MFGKTVEYLNVWIARICVGIFGMMVGVVFLQVVLRYIFDFGVPWAEESARYLQIWLTFLGACLAFEKFSHVNISFFVDKVPEQVRLGIGMLVYFATIGFLIFSIYKGFSLARFGWTMKSVGLGVPMTCIYLAIPFSFIFMILNIANNMIKIVKNHRSQDPA